MTHPNGEKIECVLRTLNICDGSRLKTLLTRPPCECALILKGVIEEEQCQDQQRARFGSRTRESLAERPDWLPDHIGITRDGQLYQLDPERDVALPFGDEL